MLLKIDTPARCCSFKSRTSFHFVNNIVISQSAKDLIDSLENGLTGAIALVERGHLLLKDLMLLLEQPEQMSLAATPSVDSLFYIAHHKNISPFCQDITDKRREERVLTTTRILILIEQEMLCLQVDPQSNFFHREMLLSRLHSLLHL